MIPVCDACICEFVVACLKRPCECNLLHDHPSAVMLGRVDDRSGASLVGHVICCSGW